MGFKCRWWQATFLLAVFSLELSPTSVSEAELFPNPLLYGTEVEADYVFKAVRFSSTEAGAPTHPRSIKISFTLKNIQKPPLSPGWPLRLLREGSFEYRLTKDQQQYVVLGETFFAEGSYFAELRLPRVAAAGRYGVQLTLKKAGVKLAEWSRKGVLHYRKPQLRVVFVIDNSFSMTRNDPQGKRYQAILKALTTAKEKQGISRLALISFADEARLELPFLTPAAFEKQLKRLWKKQVALQPRGNTSFAKAFRKLKEVLQNSLEKNRVDKKTAAIFLTDGLPTTPYGVPALRKEGLSIPLFTLGLDGMQGRYYDAALLKAFSKATGGEFFNSKAVSLEAVYKKVFSLAVGREVPLQLFSVKPRYGLGEALVLRYREATNEETRGVPEITLLPRSKAAKRETPHLLSHQPGEAIFFPLSKGSYRFEVHFKRKGAVLLSKPIIFTVLDKKRSFTLAGRGVKTLHFKQLQAGTPQVRYFLINGEPTTPPRWPDFITFRYFVKHPSPIPSEPTKPPGPLTSFNTAPSFTFSSAVSFLETPFLLPHDTERKQAVVITPATELLKRKQAHQRETLVEGYLLTLSAGGYYVDNFTYEAGLKYGTLRSPAVEQDKARATPLYKAGQFLSAAGLLGYLAVFFAMLSGGVLGSFFLRRQRS